MPGTEINCFSCRHFFITYDHKFPYGCKGAGFKSKLMPAKEMVINSGRECLLFKENQKRKQVKPREQKQPQ